jgi:dTDP-4-amino-4,6-dideoxygalactose transaminase
MTPTKGTAVMSAYLMNQPMAPDVDALIKLIRRAFGRKWLTNFGELHEAFAAALRKRLGVEHVLPVTNATVGIQTALAALGVSGEVITTPFTFPATYHVLMNMRDTTAVFADVSRDDFCLSPEAVEAAVTPGTSAVLAVHAYGFPCDVEGLARVASRHGLALVYDAAASFGVELGGRSILVWGDASVLSFHATKSLSTAEGGAVVSKTPETHDRCRLFVNFGIRNEDVVELPGVNGKLDEIRSALGIVALRDADVGADRRRRVVERYLDWFRAGRPEGIEIPFGVYERADVKHGWSYFPVVVTGAGRLTRDSLYAGLRARGVVARKYYSPTALDLPFYRTLPARFTETPNAAYLSRHVLCLPVNTHYTDGDCDAVLGLLASALDELGVKRHA